MNDPFLRYIGTTQKYLLIVLEFAALKSTNN